MEINFNIDQPQNYIQAILILWLINRTYMHITVNEIFNLILCGVTISPQTFPWSSLPLMLVWGWDCDRQKKCLLHQEQEVVAETRAEQKGGRSRDIWRLVTLQGWRYSLYWSRQWPPARGQNISRCLPTGRGWGRRRAANPTAHCKGGDRIWLANQWRV